MKAETTRSNLASTVVEPERKTEAECRRVANEIIAAWKSGEAVDARAALAEHPQLAQLKSIVIDLAYEEYCLRTEQGESIAASQFCEQFSDYSRSLREHLDLHRLVCENGDLLLDVFSAAWPRPGDDFLGYSVVGELGRGAFSRVYLATEDALGGRRVAIKICFEGAEEADTLGKLQHANIVPVYSVTHDDTGLSVICMPYLGRATLYDVLDAAGRQSRRSVRAKTILDAIESVSANDGPQPTDSTNLRWLRRATFVDGVVQLVIQLSEALSYAHATGIMHLDLKPSNVLVGRDGTPMLLDFNLSFDRQKGERRLGGTLPYMSPEQLRWVCGSDRQRNTQVDHRSDIFSLGVLLYELLSGELPFGPLPDDLSSQKMAEELLRRREVGARRLHLEKGARERLADILDRCLAFDPSDRYPSMDELGVALRAELSLAQRTRRWVKAHPIFAGACAGVMIALSVCVAVFFGLRDPLSIRELNRGRVAFERGRYETALLHLDRSIAVDATSAETWFARAKVHARIGDFDLARRNLQKARDFAPNASYLDDFAVAALALGKDAFDDGQYDTALGHLKLAVVVHPETREALSLRGRALVKLERYAEAIPDLARAIELKPNGETEAMLGYCCGKVRVHREAITWYERAIQDGFRSAAIYNNLGYSHHQLGGYRRAIVELNSALELDEDLLPALHNRALADLELSITEDRIPSVAIADIDRALKSSEGTAELYRDAARVYASASVFAPKWKASAVDCLRRATQLGMTRQSLESYSDISGLLEQLPDGKQSTSMRAPAAAEHLIDPSGA